MRARRVRRYPSVNSAGKYKWLNDLQPAFCFAWLASTKTEANQKPQLMLGPAPRHTGPNRYLDSIRQKRFVQKQKRCGRRHKKRRIEPRRLRQASSFQATKMKRTLLRSAASEVGLEEREIEKTLGSGFNAGLQHPRSAPVLSLYNDRITIRNTQIIHFPHFYAPPLPLARNASPLVKACNSSTFMRYVANAVISYMRSVGVSCWTQLQCKNQNLGLARRFWFLDVKSSGKGKTPAVNLVTM